MNQIFKNIAWILTILLIIMVTQWGGVLSNFLQNKVVEHQHDTITTVRYDTITNFIKEKTIEKRFIETIVPTTKIDTVLVIKEYLKKHIVQTRYQDTNLELLIIDTLAMNKLIGQHMEYKIYIPTITTTITKTPKINTAFYINADMTYQNKETMVYLGGVLTHKKNIYGLGISPFDKSVKISIGTLIYKK